MSDFIIEDGTLVKCNIEKGDVTIPVGVRNIGFQAISGRLKSLTFPEGVEIIGEYAIRNFYYLTVYLPKSLKEIKANDLFKENKALLPQKLAQMDSGVFIPFRYIAVYQGGKILYRRRALNKDL